jgi:hypothetical protein
MWKKFCQALGLASLILAVNFGDLLAGGADVRMHTPFSLAHICYAQIADILLLALFLFLVLVLLQRSRFYPRAHLLLIVVIPPYLMLRSQSINSYKLVEEMVFCFAIVWTSIVLLLVLRFEKLYRRLLRACSGLAAAMVFFALAAIAQLLWVATWKPAPSQIAAEWNQPVDSALAPQPPRQHPLLVWIVFDELSYDQLFEHRAHGLTLPNFDALRAQSTLYTNTQPIGYHTVVVLPSLLTGQVVDGFRYSFDNHLRVHHAIEAGWHAVDGVHSIFGDAIQNGWRTAAVGWYNPYCSIYGDAIQSCYWTNHDMVDSVMSQRAPFAYNVIHPLRQLVHEAESPIRSDHEQCTFEVRQRYQTEIDLQQHAVELLHRDQADFVFLHLAIPHSPNLWSRVHNDYTDRCGSSYIDNLALTDRVLGQFLAMLKASPRWSQTTLIVQGDHSWRTAIWNGLPAWTDEDDAASRDAFDPRPALLIHQPTQTQPQTVDAPWSILKVHSVVEQTLHSQPPAP